MTGVKKVFTLLSIALLCLGAAFGGGVYFEMQKRRAVEKQLEEAKKKSKKAEEDAVRTLAGSRGRTQVLEAVLGVIYQNYGMAFDRIVRTKALADHLGISQTVDKDIDELMELLQQQKQEAVPKLLVLADKMEPTPQLALPKTMPQAPGTVAAHKPAAPAAAPGTSPAAAPNAASPPAAPSVAPPAGQPAVPAAPPKIVGGGDEAPSHEYQEGRAALMAAKEALLSGDMPDVIKKVARAQVQLDESGYTELDEDLGTAIKAAKSKDAARVRTLLEAALARLRAR